MTEKEFLQKLAEFEPIIQAKSHQVNVPGLEWEDIAQEIRLKLWSKYRLYDPTKSDFKTWANKVSRNVIIDLLRKSKTITQSYLNKAVCYEWLVEKEEAEKSEENSDE